MQTFRQIAFLICVWKAFLAALVASILTVCFSFEVAPACLIGANVALVFSLALMLSAGRLDEDRIVRTETWRLAAEHEQLGDTLGRRFACTALADVTLRFAKGAAAVAIVLSSLALAASRSIDAIAMTAAAAQ